MDAARRSRNQSRAGFQPAPDRQVACPTLSRASPREFAQDNKTFRDSSTDGHRFRQNQSTHLTGGRLKPSNSL